MVVPGWYGCTCIKWVDRIEFVAEDVGSTAHMREFASRTNQKGTPSRARNFKPAEIDLAATVIRVERWRVDGKLRHEVVGLLWGGTETTDRLRIQLGRGAPYVPVDELDHRATNTWTLWRHQWTPKKAGTYRVRVDVDDPAVRTRRLDAGYYERAVVVEEVG